MQITTTEALPYILVREACFPGSWGRGETLADAIRAARNNGARSGPVYACAVSRDGTVDGMGDLYAKERGPLYRATLPRTGYTLAHLTEYRPARAD
jgi:hypothetical protein